MADEPEAQRRRRRRRRSGGNRAARERETEETGESPSEAPRRRRRSRPRGSVPRPEEGARTRRPREARSGPARREDEAPSRPRRSRNRGEPAPVVRRVGGGDLELDLGRLDRDARRVVSRLQREGHEAYLVGGCVRDLLIGRRPKDFDVATSATPQEIKRLFRNGRIIGRRFKLVHIHYGENIIETSTFRREPSESEGDDLLIVEDNAFGTAAEDARRRDFTVNALFLDPDAGAVHDWVDGLEDLEDRVLQTIGDPQVRFQEDPVRILRAVKFATRLDLEIAEPTWEAMLDNADQLERAAPPRVLEEILRLLRSGSALGAVKMLRACGALAELFPDLDRHLGDRDADDHQVQQRLGSFYRLLEALDQEVHSDLEPSNALCLAVLFAPLVEEELEEEEDPRARLLRAEDLIHPTAERARLAKRDWTRAARILANQPHFTEQGESRFSPLLFCLTPAFEESLCFFGLRVHARGKGWDLHEGWQERLERALDADEDELSEERNRTRKRKPRKRRRRRGTR